MTYSQVIKFYGGVTAAAKETGYHRMSFYKWRAQGEIPARAQQVIAAGSAGKLKADK